MRKITITENSTPIDKMCAKAEMSRTELAERSGVPLVTLDQWAKRKRLPRDVYQIYKVAKALGCQIEDLIEPELAEKSQEE